MEQVVVAGLSKVQEMGAVFALLIVIVAVLAWEVRRLSNRIEKLTSDFMASLGENGDRFAAVVEKNTSAFVELRDLIRECSRK